MFCEPRIDDFRGSSAEYIKFLETELLTARRQLKPTPPTPPESQCEATSAATSPERQTAPNDEIEQTQWTFVPETPPKLVQEKCSNQTPAWHAELDALLIDIPSSNRWKEKRAQIEMSSFVQNHSVLTILLGGPLNFHLLADRPTGNCGQSSGLNSLLGFANRYGYATSKTQKHAQFASTVGVFQELVFVSLCVILEASGTPKDLIDTLMKPCFTAKTSKSLERIRGGARWANRCIASLSTGDWGLRSTEIFLLCGRPVPLYGRLFDATNESSRRFTEQLDSSQYTMEYTEVKNWLPYHIPCIIKVLIGDSLTLHKICKYLDYPVTVDDTLINLCESYKQCISTENLSSPSPLNVCWQKSKKPRRQASSRKAHPRRKANTGSNLEILRVEVPKQTEQQNGGDWLCRNLPAPGRPQDPPSITSPPCDELNTLEVLTQSLVNDDAETAMGFDISAMMEPSLAEEMMEELDTAAMQANFDTTMTGFDITTIMEVEFDMITRIETEMDMTTEIESGHNLNCGDTPRFAEGDGTNPMFDLTPSS